MCGILSYHKIGGLCKKDIKEAFSSLKTIRHRGPDGEGGVLINTKTGDYKIIKTDETPLPIKTDISIDQYKDYSYDLFLGHRRLSIFDLSLNGHQPMFDKETGNWIIYNGEIYNFPELKKELKNKQFNSETDTEIILKYYAAYGKKCLSEFNGMWAFIIWDNKKKKIFISRDRFGVKPLFYYKDSQRTIFVSEQKQLLAFSNIKLDFNKDVIKNYIDTGYIYYNNDTFFNDVFRFPAAHFSYFASGSNDLKTARYYKLSLKKQKISESDAIEGFNEIFSSSVRIRTRADVDWGVGLSGGLDSSAVIYEINKQLENTKKTVKSFSSVSPGRVEDESKFIKFIEKDLKIKSFYTNPLEKFSIQDFNKFIYHIDTPVPGTTFYAQWKVAELAKQKNTTVLLVGQGADEIFAGYHQHFAIYCTQLITAGKIKTYINLVTKYAELKAWNPYKLHLNILFNNAKTLMLFKLGLSKLSKTLVKKWYSVNNLSKALRTDLESFQLPYFLHADDHSGMAFSVETRHPFMDYRLIDFAFSVPDNYKIKDGWQKYLIRKSSKGIPDFIRYRKDKKGFSTPQKEIVSALQKKYKIKYSSDRQVFFEVWKKLK